jgi:hypothetical protein
MGKPYFYIILIVIAIIAGTILILNLLLFNRKVKKEFMGNNETILIIGRHQFIMDRVIPLLKEHNYNAFGVATDEEAIDFVKNNKVDAVLIGGGVEDASRKLFHTEFITINPNIKIIDASPKTVLEDLKEQLGNK